MADQTITACTHPRNKASWFSKLNLAWITVSMKKGNKRPLEEKDLFPTLNEDKMEFLMTRIENNWERERKLSQQRGRNPKLWKALAKTMSLKEFTLLASAKLLRFASSVGLPLLLWSFLKYLSSVSETNLLSSLFYVVGISLLNFVKGFSLQHGAFISDRWSVRLKVSSMVLIYKKILFQLRRRDLHNILTGNTINLVSVDAKRLELVAFPLMLVSLAPIEILATASILWYLFGWSALTGLLFYVVLALFNFGMSYYAGALRHKAAAVTDKRLEIISEIVSGIRAVKMYAWEWNFTEVIKVLRKKEISLIRLGGLIVSLLDAFIYTALAIGGFISIATLILSGEHVSAFQIFTVLSCLGLVHLTVTAVMGDSLHYIMEGLVAVKRIQHFISDTIVHLAGNTNSDGISNQGCQPVAEIKFKGIAFSKVAYDNDENITGLSYLKKSGVDSSHQMGNLSLMLRDVDCSWSKDERQTLSKISLSVEKGQMLAVTGPVGSGKSSLLMAILGELPLTRGSLLCNGRVAYVPQIPWVFSGTVQENIVFGKAFDGEKFQNIIEVCSLVKDLQSFPKGDLTEIGQRGIRLSGGQRQRVSLARALYSDADVYLLDDPLSAVDAKVGQHLFNSCICGFLSDRTRVLVTHQLHYLTNLNHIVVLNKGRVRYEGSYSQLREVEEVWEGLVCDQVSSTRDDHKDAKNVEDPERLYQPNPEEVKDLEEDEEERAIGAITWQTYWKYFRVALPIPLIVLLVTFVISIKVIVVAPFWWASKIADMSYEEQKQISTLAIFGATGLASLLTEAIAAYLVFSTMIRASEKLHNKMVMSVIKAPILFFDKTPLGRILNRFSKDIGSMDDLLPIFLVNGVEVVLIMTASVLIPAVTNVWLFLAAIPFFAIALYVAQYQLNPTRELKRLEATTCSPVYAHIAETLRGLEVIRSSAMQDVFLNKLFAYQDVNTSALNMVIACRRWLGICMGHVCSAMVAATTAGALLVTQNAALAGLSLIFVLEIVDHIQYGIWSISEVENTMTSAERVMHYTELDQEPGYNCDILPPQGWPQQGNMTLQDLSLVYIEGGTHVLNNISLSIAAKEKIGVAGRTGAGKSSLVAALFRMPDPYGKVLIDGLDIGNLNLQAARRSMAVITQDPVLFRGSLRNNLDPFGTFNDKQLWTVLEEVQMKNLVEILPGQLDYQLKESGSNFSAGERQLLCLARALVQGSKIIIMDEATANVDFKTDHLIQQVIRSKFQDCTVLTIAHRLNTIIDYDKVLVLDGGRVVEFDKPEILLNNKNGLFAELVRCRNQASKDIGHVS